MKVLAGVLGDLEDADGELAARDLSGELESRSTISTTPWRASIVVPSGTVAPAASVVNRWWPGSSTVIRPETGASAGRRVRARAASVVPVVKVWSRARRSGRRAARSRSRPAGSGRS